jgi:hypothetical protein
MLNGQTQSLARTIAQARVLNLHQSTREIPYSLINGRFAAGSAQFIFLSNKSLEALVSVPPRFAAVCFP